MLNLVFFFGTAATYMAYNYGDYVTFKYGSMALYPFLIFALTGNYRVMLLYCKWDKWQHLSYKLMKLFGAIFFLVYGAYETKNKNVNNPDLFLLYIFSTFAYYSEMYFGINRLDGVDNLLPDYQVKSTIQSKRLVTTKLIQMNNFTSEASNSPQKIFQNPLFVKPEQDKKAFHKINQPLWLFFLVYSCQLATILLALLLLIVLIVLIVQDRKTVNWSTNRCVDIQLNLFGGATRSVLRDNNLLFVFGTCATYLAYNYGNYVTFKYGAMAVYPFLIFFLTENYRVMLIYCNWARWQLVMYKLLKLFGAMFFLAYGSYTTKNKSLTEPDLFLLYIFKTFAYYAQMYFGINRLDGADKLSPDYSVKQKIDSERLVTQKLIKNDSYLD